MCMCVCVYNKLAASLRSPFGQRVLVFDMIIYNGLDCISWGSLSIPRWIWILFSRRFNTLYYYYWCMCTYYITSETSTVTDIIIYRNPFIKLIGRFAFGNNYYTIYIFIMYKVCFIPPDRCGNNNVVAVAVDSIVWQNAESICIYIILVLLYNCTHTWEWAYYSKGLSTDDFIIRIPCQIGGRKVGWGG